MLHVTETGQFLSNICPRRRLRNSWRTAEHVVSPILPVELFDEIAEHLASSYSLGTLASFNITSRETHTSTLRSLYRSLILVTRDPQGIEEWEKPLPLGASVPQGWKYTQYLSVGPVNHDLLMKHAALRSKSSDTEPLQTLFPRSVLLSLRNPELQRAKDLPGTSFPPPSAFGFEITKTTKIAVHVYRSITPSDLLSASVIGTHRGETACAMNTFRSASETYTSRFLSFGADAGVEVEDAGVEGDLRDETLCDNIYRISFAPRARFLAENVEAEERTIPMARSGTAESRHLMVDGSTLNNDDSPGSRSRDIARGLLGVLPSQRANEDRGTVRKHAAAEGSSGRTPMDLPILVAQADHAIYKPLLYEDLIQALARISPKAEPAPARVKELEEHRANTESVIMSRRKLRCGVCRLNLLKQIKRQLFQHLTSRPSKAIAITNLRVGSGEYNTRIWRVVEFSGNPAAKDYAIRKERLEKLRRGEWSVVHSDQGVERMWPLLAVPWAFLSVAQ
ncbi:hypothetical protein QFC21_007079 [Naganishia friedmannii]|uniref:Uncharacterized protein n=1 Tax=Naganishia friedmannii TaxID=89922 RepID=A0ACC2UYG0_9TREE|nr:hypothetical protein QFC21_007079 [Naganishia friedmannii]